MGGLAAVTMAGTALQQTTTGVAFLNIVNAIKNELLKLPATQLANNTETAGYIVQSLQSASGKLTIKGNEGMRDSNQGAETRSV